MALSEETKRKLNEARSTTLGGGEASRPSSLSDDTKAKLDAAKGDLFTKTPEQTERENAVSFANQFGELKKRYEQQRNLTAMRESLGLPDINTFSPEERKQAQEMGEYMRGQQASQVIEDYAEKHPVTGTIMGSVGSLGGATEYFKALKEDMQGGRYTGYDSYNGGSVIVPSPTRISQAATSGATKASAKNLANVVRTVNNTIPFFETDEEAEAWGSKLGEDVQSVITSQIQSLAVGSTLGKYGALLLGGSAASSAYLEAIDRGDSVRNALLHGAASGVAEAAAEYLPLDNLTKIMRGGKKPLVQTLTALLQQTITEGLEEGATDLASTIADSLIYMTPEELDKAVATELAAGKGNAKAYADALSNVVFKGLSDIDLAEVGRDMALGAVGGLLGGGVATIGGRIATNAADVSTGAALRNSGVTPQSLADAAKATGAETKTAEKMSKRQMGKAYREISNANTRTAIEVRLAQNGVSDSKAVADIIVKAVRDEESLTGEERRTLENPGVKQVLEDVKEYASSPSDSSWLASAGQATNFAVRVGLNQQENRGLIESLQRVTDEGSTLDSATQEFRAEEMAATADEIGVPAEDIAEAYGKRENEGISLERYATVLKMAYAYGQSARPLQEWATTTGLSTDDAVNKAYENGQKAYLEKGRGEIARAKASSAKVKYMSQTSLDRINPKFSAVDVKSMSSAQKAFAAFLNKVVAPRIHRTIYLFDGADIKTNGWNDSTGIYININAKNGTRTFDMLGTFLHEFGHEIRIESPELFAELTQIVVDNWYRGDRGSFDAAVQAKIAARKETVDKYGEGDYIDEPQAVEEIVCESLSKLAERPEDMEKIFAGHETLAQRALTYLKKILAAVKEAIASITGKSNMYAEMMDAEALEKAVDVLSRYVEQVNQKVNQVTETVETELAESGIELDQKTGTAMFSTQDVPQTEEEINVAVERLAKALNVSEADARRWVESELSAASLILDPKFNGMDAAGVNYLDYESDRRLGAIKKNSDYPQGTLDFSNICRKRVEYTKLMQRLQKQFPNRVFTAEELAEIREILIRNDIEVACGLCFVEDRRQNETGIAKLFQEAMTSWFAGEREMFNAGQTKALQMLNGGESIPSIYELTTLDGMRDLRAKAPNVADAWETFNNARGMQSARLLQREAEYKRQILKFKSARVKAINNVGGLRIYSFSDFQEFHLLDILQAIQDCAAMGIKIQAYTKVPSFAKLVKDTGVKINRSLIPLGTLGYHVENGKTVLDYDLREGINVKDKNFFDSTDNPNVGNVLVGINDEQISAAMLDPFVDYIIPFHTGQKSDVLAIKKIAEWVNYKNYQTDKPLPGTKRTKMINIYTEVLQAAEKEGKPITNKVEFVNKFLEVCKKEGMRPRFWQFLNVDENGDYTYREGYHKFLVDFKMFDADGNILPQEKVVPNFDNEFITELLSEYVKSQAEKQASLAPKLNKAYAEIEKKVINKSFSTQDDEYLELAKDPKGNAERLREMVEDAAKKAGYNSPLLYHGTDGFGFTTIDTRYSDDRFSFFATDSVGTASTYTRGKAVTPVDKFPISEKALKTKDGFWRSDDGVLKYLDNLGIEYTTHQNAQGETKVRVPAWDTQLNDGRHVYDIRYDNSMLDVSYTLYKRYGVRPGIYQLYATTDNLLIIEGKGANWSQIELGQIEHDYNYDSGRKGWYQRATTRQIAKFAHGHGYDGVLFKNIRDSGPKGALAGTSDVYAFFKPKRQVKSADLVTYDKNGDIIPLSQRFDPQNIDIRFSTQDAEAAPTFYSQMGKVIEQQKANKFDARSLINMLLGKGVKAEEIKWSGIAAWLDGKKSVAKEELQEFVRGSMLQVEDEWLTNRNWDSNNWADYDAAESYTYTEARTIIDDMVRFDELKDGKAAQRSLRVDYEDDVFYAYAKIDGEEKMILKYNPRERATRWAQYTLPYTENYRELKLKMPGADYSNKAMQAHWRESGVLAHARVGDVFEEAEPVIDPETGEVHPIFFIEEIQSDWHNAGNKSGYLSAEDARKRAEGVKALDDFKTLIDYGLENPSAEEFETQVNDILANMGSTMRIENHLSDYLIYDEGLRRSSFLPKRVTLRRLLNILSEDAPAPEAPFKDGKYVDFVMKKLLRTAAEEGYHKIGWTTAKQQSERWSDSYAEGYRIEYDQDIPKFLNKYGKQWGAKASQETLRNGDVIWTFPINEAMRNSVVYEGQPMYSMQDIENSTVIRSASMLSGGGLMEQGLEYQLLIHDFGVEYDTSIAATWLENNGDGHIYAGKEEGDVLKFDAEKYKGKLFHFHASPVCHNFSPAKQHAKETEEDRAMARAVLRNFIATQAPVCTVENGVRYINSESAKIIMDGLRADGYEVDVDVYDSADYGSPQTRKRTIIRAVKGMPLPPKPRTIPRTNTWDRVTRNLWDSLPEITEGDIAESYLKAVKATGIDINNVKVPTLLLQTASNGKVAYAEEGELSPALTTHCYEAVLALPGGKILKPDAKFLGRIMGLPDDFVYPHHKDGRVKTSVAATVIGNGVPVELSKAVIGGVIEYAYAQTYGQAMYSTQDEEIPTREGTYPTGEGDYSIRDDMDTRNIIASILLDQIRNQEDKETLRRYLETSNIQRAALDRRDELIKMLRTPGVATAEQLAEAKKELASIRKAIQAREHALNEIETQPRIQTLIRNQYDTIKEYERLVAEEREENQQRIRELRAKMNEKVRAEIDKRIAMRRDLMAKARQQRANDYYIPRIEKAFADMRKNLEKAPEAFRAPFYAFMAAIDFRSLDKDGNVRMTRNEKVGSEKVAVPNEANIRKTELMDALDQLAHGDPVKGTRPWYEAYDIIASEDILDWIEDTRTALKKVVALMSGDVIDSNVRSATSDLLKNIYQLARMFNSTIKHLSKAYTNANLDISNIAKQFSKHANELGARKNNKVSRVERFLRYDNAQPVTVFDRLGDAGQTLFNLLTRGQSKYAFNYQEILDYAKDWDKKALRKWTKDVVKVKFGNEEVEMTPAQMISLYLTAKNEDGRRHLLEGGFKLGERRLTREKFKTAYHTVVDATRQITDADIQNLIDTMNQYSPELISMAENISTFLNTTAKRWANQISIARYGYEQFTVPNYFPLFSIKGDTVGDIDKFRAKGDVPGSFYGFLNRSFTKERQVNADDALVINDALDVFTDYVGNVALYNAFALPVLDVARFLGYSERNEEGNIAWSVAEKLNAAYGQGVMRSYIEGLLDSINGQQYMTNAESLGLTALRIRNRVAVAANFRVALQQPFSIVRAADVISPKYFRPFKFDETRREMKKYSGIAVWKHQNNYDADIKMPLKNELVGASTAYGEFVRSATDWGMKAAEFGDEMTWAAIWNACKNYVNETSPGLEGQKYFDAVDAKFNEVIYRTQVVDSVLQKSQVMREKNFFAKMVSAFKSEPTTSYNMLLRQYDRLMEAKQAGNTQAVWNIVRGPMLRSIVVFALNGIVNALVTALVDAMRDDDDYETMTEKMREAFFGEYSGSSKGWQQFLRSNLFEGINPFGIPYLADALSLLQGYEPDRVDLIAVEGALSIPATVERLFQTPTFKDAFKVLDAASKISGLPMSNMMRDVVSIWNSTFGTIDHNLKMQTSPESAKSGYEALYKAMTEGKDVRAAQLVDEINDNIGDPDKAYQGVTGIMRDAYKKGDLTRDEARKYLSMAGVYFEIDRTEKQIESRIDDWDKQKQN